MTKFDLHMHSCYSKDGEFTPKELIQIAKEKQLQYVALSDHDCMRGIDDMIEEGAKQHIQVIPAIEFSTLFTPDIECHLLGYGFDYHQEYFIHLQDKLQKLSDDAFTIRVQKFKEIYGIEIDEKQIIEEANGNNPWFLLCTKIFQDPANANIKDFQDYLPGGKRSDPAPVNFFWDQCQKGSPLYVHVAYPSFEETVQLIHDAGGIAILAHPFQTFYQREDLLQMAINYGIDGIEVYSNYHEPKHNRFYEDFAKKHDLLMTCGSDFHGKLKPSIQMGDFGEEVVHSDMILNRFLDALK